MLRRAPQPGAVVLLAALLLVLGIVVTASMHADRRAAEPVAAAPAPGNAGLRVAIDPETGELGMPSPEQAAALEAEMEAMLSRSQAGIAIVHHPDGRKTAHLNGRFMNMSVGHIDADGRLHSVCVEDAAAANQARHTCSGPRPGVAEVQ